MSVNGQNSLDAENSSSSVRDHGSAKPRRSAPPATGVLLIGHGTRDEQGTAQFLELTSTLAEYLKPLPVEGALLEFQEPTIPQAWDRLVSRSVERIHAAPLLLFSAGHAKQDIPGILRECSSRTSGIRFEQSRPISRHPAMVELAVERLRSAMSEVSATPERTAVVMVGRGSYDPCAQADMRVLSEVVARRASVKQVFTAFYAMAEPRLPEVLDHVAESGKFESIVVQPHLLFEGRLYQAILRQISEAASRHAAISWHHSDYLGPDPLVAQAIAGRVGIG